MNSRDSSQRSPSCCVVSATTVSASKRSPQNAWKKPKRPSRTVGGPVSPSRAMSAATTPAWAAQPQCTRLTVPPVRLASMMPDPMLAAMPMAEQMPSASRPRSMAAATAAPIAPQIAVACRPRSKNTELPRSASYWAMPSRQVTSMPTAPAASSCAPLAPTASAVASAAGSTDADGCRTDGRWVSSKSRLCARVPLTRAADGAGSRVADPMTVAAGVPPHSSVRSRTAAPGRWDRAARLLPIRSSRWPVTFSRSSSGRPVSRTDTANAASCRAAVGWGVEAAVITPPPRSGGSGSRCRRRSARGRRRTGTRAHRRRRGPRAPGVP